MEQKKELEERVVMSHKNTSDSIEEYIKAILAQAGIAELKRSEIADVFQVVPSQINYVIKTRFTESRGYVVESKRGGGVKIGLYTVKNYTHHELLCDLLHSVGEQISQQVFTDIIQLLFDEKIMTEREGNLLLATTTDRVLGVNAAQIRAQMLKKILQQVDRKGKN